MKFSNKAYIEENIQKEEIIPKLEVDTGGETINPNNNKTLKTPIESKGNITESNKLTIKK